MEKEKFLKLAKTISERLILLPTLWDGRGSILEMKDSGFKHWRQMEWIGWYFQFLCERSLKEIMQIPGPKFGNSSFDGFFEIPWDFKAHAMNTSHHHIIVNDSESTAKAIQNFGSVGLALAIGKVEYNDEERSFQKWHEEIKGGKSNYEFERIKRGAWSRLRKTQFKLVQISFIKIDDEVLVKCGSFQRDFRNANGKPRREKVLVDLEKIDEEVIYFLNFEKNN
jgi:hypothetical protein